MRKSRNKSNAQLANDRPIAPEKFFRPYEAALAKSRRAELARRSARAALAAASRITDDILLDQLVSLGISADTLVTLSLVPLVEVAWADGVLQPEEKHAIVQAARASGLDMNGMGIRLLERCLSERPGERVIMLWRQYIRSVCATLSPSDKVAFKAELLSHAQRVAEAAGGILGTESRVSNDERMLLAKLEQAFGDDA